MVIVLYGKGWNSGLDRVSGVAESLWSCGGDGLDVEVADLCK